MTLFWVLCFAGRQAGVKGNRSNSRLLKRLSSCRRR